MRSVPDRRLFRIREPALNVDDILIHEPVPDGASVPEALVQDLWEAQRFDRADLTTTDGAPIRILDPGVLNTDAGPDFSNAHIKIDGVDWHGDVEIHVRSGAWFDHSHDDDKRYDRVVLHVTLHPDLHTGRIPRSDGSLIPEVVLAPRLKRPLRSMLRAFYKRKPDDLVCAPRWDEVAESTRMHWIRELGARRLEERALHLQNRLDTGTPAEMLLHERLFAGLGYSKNTAPMIDLARRLPINYVRSVNTPRDRVALHLGTAGLLPDPSELLDADRETADIVMDFPSPFFAPSRTSSDSIDQRCGVDVFSSPPQ